MKLILALLFLPMTVFAQDSYHFQDQSEVVIDSQHYLQLNYSSSSPLNQGVFWGNVAGTTAATIGILAWDPSQDKVRHFFAGYIIANVTTGGFQLLLPADMKHRRLVASLAGFGTSLLVGAGKEYWDSRGHGVASTRDFLATGTGGLAGTLTISFDLRKKPKKRVPGF